MLVRRQSVAENGDAIVALIDNEVAIKEYSLSGDAVVLKPRSSNKAHKPILVTEDLQVQGIVITAIANFEG